MTMLQVSLFGQVRARFTDQVGDIRLTPGIQALLAFLVLHHNRLFSREILANLFWGDSNHEKARNSLNTALWRLRNALEPEGVASGSYLLGMNSGEVGFNADSACWLDVQVFEECATKVIKRPLEEVSLQEIDYLQSALNCYTSDLLEEFFEDWALRERERMRTLYLNSLAYLMSYYHREGILERAITYGRQILAIDPLREEIHREIIRMYLKTSNHASAVRQYEICAQVLRTELGIDPMIETRALLQEIHSSSPQEITPVMLSTLDVQSTLAYLHRTAELIDQVRAQVWKLIDDLEVIKKQG